VEPPRLALDYLAKRKQVVQDCGQTVRRQLNTALRLGIEAGETTKELAVRVRGVFNDLQKFEASRIAVTETNGAYSTSRHDAMKQAGITHKAWLSSHGPTVRDGHAAAEEIYTAQPIPLDEPFEVNGEQMQFPLDDSLGASAENIINCQCIQLAAMPDGEDEKSISFLIHGIGRRSYPKQS
jgi:hypothetical protein